MGDIDKDEIDLDDDDDNNNTVKDIARFVNIICYLKYFIIVFSTVQPGHRNDEPINDEDDDMDNLPFTLNDGDELSDDEQLDDNEYETKNNQHIHENFKVDNERGIKRKYLLLN